MIAQTDPHGNPNDSGSASSTSLDASSAPGAEDASVSHEIGHGTTHRHRMAHRSTPLDRSTTDPTIRRTGEPNVGDLPRPTNDTDRRPRQAPITERDETSRPELAEIPTRLAQALL